MEDVHTEALSAFLCILSYAAFKLAREGPLLDPCFFFLVVGLRLRLH